MNVYDPKSSGHNRGWLGASIHANKMPNSGKKRRSSLRLTQVRHKIAEHQS